METVGGGRKISGAKRPKNFCSCPHYSILTHLLGAHAFFCSPVEAMHAVTIMSLKAKGLQLSVDTC